MQHLRESIVVLDANDQVRLMNASAAQLLGAPDPPHGRQLNEVAETLADYVTPGAKTWL